MKPINESPTGLSPSPSVLSLSTGLYFGDHRQRIRKGLRLSVQWYDLTYHVLSSVLTLNNINLHSSSVPFTFRCLLRSSKTVVVKVGEWIHREVVRLVVSSKTSVWEKPLL